MIVGMTGRCADYMCCHEPRPRPARNALNSHPEQTVGSAPIPAIQRTVTMSRKRTLRAAVNHPHKGTLRNGARCDVSRLLATRRASWEGLLPYYRRSRAYGWVEGRAVINSNPVPSWSTFERRTDRSPCKLSGYCGRASRPSSWHIAGASLHPSGECLQAAQRGLRQRSVRKCDLDSHPARLSTDDRYRLRLLGERNRHYLTSKGLNNLVALGLAALTGHRNEVGRAEWAITEAGRAVLAADGILPLRRHEQRQHAVSSGYETITGPQLRAARVSLGWRPQVLATRAKVPLSVIERSENSLGEPAITIGQLNALMQALRSADASFQSYDAVEGDGEDQP